MTDPDRPLTTGEGNTEAIRARAEREIALRRGNPCAADALDLLAECGRLREQLDAARQALEAQRVYLGFAIGILKEAAPSRIEDEGHFANRALTYLEANDERARAALGVEGPQPDERVDLKRPQPPQGVSAVGRTTRKADTGAGFHPATRPTSQPPGVEGPAAGDGQP